MFLRGWGNDDDFNYYARSSRQALIAPWQRIDEFAILHVYVSVWRGDRGPITGKRQDFTLGFRYSSCVVRCGQHTVISFTPRRRDLHPAARLKSTTSAQPKLSFYCSHTIVLIVTPTFSIHFVIYNVSYGITFIPTRTLKYLPL